MDLQPLPAGFRTFRLHQWLCWLNALNFRSKRRKERPVRLHGRKEALPLLVRYSTKVESYLRHPIGKSVFIQAIDQRKLGSNTSVLRTNRILRLEMMKGGARLRLDLDEGWCQTLHYITIYHKRIDLDEGWCETLHYKRIDLDEGWCETLHYIE